MLEKCLSIQIFELISRHKNQDKFDWLSWGKYKKLFDKGPNKFFEQNWQNLFLILHLELVARLKKHHFWSFFN